MRTVDRTHDAPGLALAIDDAIGWADQIRLARHACCCTAAPAVAVVLPPSPGRPESTDLLLCGHHYRRSATALAAAGARVYDRIGRRVVLRAGTTPGFPGPS